MAHKGLLVKAQTRLEEIMLSVLNAKNYKEYEEIIKNGMKEILIVFLQSVNEDQSVGRLLEKLEEDNGKD